MADSDTMTQESINMRIVRALLHLALLCVLFVLGSGTVLAQESFPPGCDPEFKTQ